MERMEYLKNKARGLTLKPGVYLMKDKSSQIIYVGKAKNLKNRVSTYFRNAADQHEKVRKMVSLVQDFDFIVTDTEFEALVLECSLIKQYNPKYNIMLKDDKGYSYIEITKKPYPRIRQALQKLDNDSIYLGPYTSSYAVKQTVEDTNTVFMLPTCNRKFPQDFKKSRPCLNYYIKKCTGVCRGNASEEIYNQTIDQAISYIKGGSVNSIESLTKEMFQASDDLEFERAADLRKKIEAIKKISQTQKIIQTKEKDIDIIGSAQMGNHICFVVIQYRYGQLVDKVEYILPDSFNAEEDLREFITRYYNLHPSIPKLIYLDREIEDIQLIRDYLTQLSNHSVHITVPKIGEGKKLVLMAQSNAAEQLSFKAGASGKEISALDDLARLLGLPFPPTYIEAYDISNLKDSGIVGGMVVFENGRPLKSAYKRFSMKENLVQNDYASMSEMLRRRLQRYVEEKDSGTGFGRLPDLILLDGGKGHVSAVGSTIDAFHLSIPYFGMVKDDRHRTRAIAQQGGEIAINKIKAAFHLVSRIQDEVHRYTISYQKKVRKKTNFELQLTSIEGIGPKKALTLIKHFKTKKKLKEATNEDIAKVARVSLKKATEIHHYVQTL